MSKQPRIEFPGAVYHVLSRGYKKKRIYIEDKDFLRFQKNLFDVKEKFGIKIHAYVIMPNHFHLLIETPKPNLSKAMHSLKIKYANYYNLKHSDAGKVFHDKYKAIVVDKDAYFLEVFRYILLNPLCSRPKRRVEFRTRKKYAKIVSETAENHKKIVSGRQRPFNRISL